MAIRGELSSVSPLEIYGWARDSRVPARPLEVSLVLAGKVVARTTANLLYEPFAHMGAFVARCGFILDVSGLAGGGPSVASVVAGGGTIPGGHVNLLPYPAQEIEIKEAGIANVFVCRPGLFTVESRKPLRQLSIVSRSTQVGDDVRRLGLVVDGFKVNGAGVDIGSATMFQSGFHEPEHDAHGSRRWTCGVAAMHFAAEPAVLNVEFHVYVLAAAPPPTLEGP